MKRPTAEDPKSGNIPGDQHTELVVLLGPRLPYMLGPRLPHMLAFKPSSKKVPGGAGFEGMTASSRTAEAWHCVAG